MKKSLMIIVGLLTAAISFAQETNRTELRTNYPDSLVLTTDNENEIVFLFNRISRNKAYFSSDLWKSVINVMETAIERSDVQEGISVQYEVGSNQSAQVTISELTPAKSMFLIKNGSMKEVLSSRVEFLIVQPQVAVSFTVQNRTELEAIKDLNIESVWSEIKEKYENEGKVNLYKGVGTVKYGDVSVMEIKDGKLRLDNLEITFLGVGLGYYRDQFIPDLGSKLAFKMYNRLGKEWIDFGFLYTQQYIYNRTENGFNMDLNGWLTTYGKLHFSGGNELGLGIGTLIHRQGDFYENATFKLSLFSNRSDSRFTYSPELIFTDDFKEFFPSIRVGLSF